MKETIFLECDGDDYVHCCRYQQDFIYVDNKDCDNKNISTLFGDNRCGDHFMITIFTNNKFPIGQKMKLTLETIDDE